MANVKICVLFLAICFLVFIKPSWALFIDNNDGTITDTITNLIWMKSDDSVGRNWESALLYCENLSHADQTDWRLPNIRELHSIVDYSRHKPAASPYFNCKPDLYWSSSTYTFPDNSGWDAHSVSFWDGFSFWSEKWVEIYVRCVRGGPGGKFGPLAFFEFSKISSSQEIDTPFTVTVTAKDESGNRVWDFNDSVSLSSTLGRVNPTSINLSNGQATVSISVSTCGLQQLRCNILGKEGQSNFFYVLGESCSGTTIITHGYQKPTNNELPEWVITMADAIRDRASEFSIETKIIIYHADYDSFQLYKGNMSDKQTVFIFDWTDHSNENYHGFSEAAGDALFATLLFGEKLGGWSLNHMHFIGHSRGAVVNSEAVERLLSIGRKVDHVTYLDPHDDGWAEICNDHDVNDWNNMDDQGVVAWRGTSYVDNFWSSDDCPTNFDPSKLDGEEIVGVDNSNSQNLSNRGSVADGITFCDNIDHSGVHRWYHGTIDHSAGSDETSDTQNQIYPYWYGNLYPSRSVDGYNCSVIASGKTCADNPNAGLKFPVSFNWELEGIVNGNFNRGPQAIEWNPFPGWTNYGGGGDGHFDSYHLELDSSNTWREHNRFYIPNDVLYISFNARVDIASGNDILAVSIGNPYTNQYETVFQKTLETKTNYFSEYFVIPESHKGEIRTIKFAIVKGGSITDSQVSIDNVQFGYPVYIEKGDSCIDTPPCSTNIQDGIHAAISGSTLRISEGFYDENLFLDDSKNLTIHGGWASEFSANSVQNETVARSLTINSGSLTLRNFTLSSSLGGSSKEIIFEDEKEFAEEQDSENHLYQKSLLTTPLL